MNILIMKFRIYAQGKYILGMSWANHCEKIIFHEYFNFVSRIYAQGTYI